ncbi:tRNA pseudouridine synthase D [Perkinsela sp. CCAP 1560/4]|nr:tRNA pseudouridine synthase D [Perkinsela sp. CCAP 1560/4]|eukprot:KNH09326.1 tRNA pseudouridine synthase D [Perkinsela sp. CCAP 1560/4]
MGFRLPKTSEKGDICLEVQCKAQVCLAQSTSKKHREYPYYIRKNEFVFRHGQPAISKSCDLLQNDTFNAMIAGNPRALSTTMKKMMRAERTKRTPGNTPCSAAAVLWQAKVHSLTRRSFKISNDIAKLRPPSRETDTLKCARSTTYSKLLGLFTQRGFRCVCTE